MYQRPWDEGNGFPVEPKVSLGPCFKIVASMWCLCPQLLASGHFRWGHPLGSISWVSITLWPREQLLLFLERASKPQRCSPGPGAILPSSHTFSPKHLLLLWKIIHSQILFLSCTKHIPTQTDSGMISWVNHAVIRLFIGAAFRQRFWCEPHY